MVKSKFNKPIQYNGNFEIDNERINSITIQNIYNYYKICNYIQKKIVNLFKKIKDMENNKLLLS